MAELTAFNYSPGNTILHQVDIRLKLICIIIFDIVSLQIRFHLLGILTLPLVFSLIFIKLPIKRALWEMKPLIFFLIVILISNAISSQETLIIASIAIPISISGLIEGGLVCWRLVIIIIAGLLFVFTSKPLDIKAAIEWFLKPLPLIPEKRLALMISLMIRFLPEILKQANEINEAQKARGIESRKNPIVRITLFSATLFRRVFENADDLVTALESRNYNDSRTDIELVFKKIDLAFLMVMIGYFGLLTTIALSQFN